MAFVPVRRFPTVELSVDLQGGAWYVVERPIGGSLWQTLGGPYVTLGAAIEWIKAL